MKNKVLTIRPERRDMFFTVVMWCIGIPIMLFGLMGILMFLPLVLIIIGIPLVIGACGIVAIGILVIAYSAYESTECPNCGKTISPLIGKDALTCKACKERIIIEF